MSRSSTVFSVMNLYTFTGFVWPIRWHRSCAWRSTCGLKSESLAKEEQEGNNDRREKVSGDPLEREHREARLIFLASD